MLIDIQDLTITYPAAASPALEQVNLRIPPGELTLVIGRTGSGKSTLLGALNGLVPRFSGGNLAGRVTVAGLDTADHDPREFAEIIGYVGQDPLRSFVTDVVEEEIAYGMEQLGVDTRTMRKRVEETLDLMGIGDLRRRSVRELSGGQQQRVAIAAVLAAGPQLLVLDEPTSALDPTAAADVLSAITNLVLDAGLSVVLAEHRIERVMKQVDRVVWLPGDRTLRTGEPGDILGECDVRPPLAELAQGLGWRQVPLSVRQARRWLDCLRDDLVIRPTESTAPGEVLLHARGLSVNYGPIVAVNQVDLELHSGEVTALMGRNGAGKSSLLWALQGSIDSSGELSVAGADPRNLGPRAARKVITLVPQTAADLLYLPTVAAELAQANADADLPAGRAEAFLDSLGVDIDTGANPHDLSEGQRLALVLAIQLVAEAPVVLLDEPTRGLDYETKRLLARFMRACASRGQAVLVSTHDVEFAAIATDRMIVMADADFVADGPTREVAVSSPAYAPQVARCLAPRAALIVEDLVLAKASVDLGAP